MILFRKTTENPIHLKRNKRSFECSGIAGDLISAKAFKILTSYTIKYVFCIKKDCRGVYSSIYIHSTMELVSTGQPIITQNRPNTA